ncbi:MAG TPA: glycosyl transferase family 1, partial [Chloroflexota bacterium]|nr:glycosyl transferase family 1 [Chloroflexota bacterium]
MANAAIECPLKLVPTGTRSFDDYRPYASEEQFDQVRDRAVRLRGLRLIEINSTPRGGGVATMLQSIIPVLTGLGLDVQWYSMCNDRAFFDVTKKLAYLLQGGQ